MSIRILALAGISICLFAVPSAAHHSGAMYNAENTVEVEATVKAFQWTNPHAWLLVTMSDGEAAGSDVDLELGSPVQLARQGWLPRTVAPGDKVTVRFHPHKDGAKSGLLVTVLLPDGRTLGSD